jgi:hypothetical protein
MATIKINNVTALTETGGVITVDSAVTGIPAAGVTGVLPSAVTGGSGLNALSASNLSAGTVPDARFRSNYLSSYEGVFHTYIGDGSVLLSGSMFETSQFVTATGPPWPSVTNNDGGRVSNRDHAIALIKLRPTSSQVGTSKRLYTRTQVKTEAECTGASLYCGGAHEGDLQLFGYSLGGEYFSTDIVGTHPGFQGNHTTSNPLTYTESGYGDGTETATPHAYWSEAVYGVSGSHIGRWEQMTGESGSGRTGRASNPLPLSTTALLSETYYYHETSGITWGAYIHGRTQSFTVQDTPIYVLIGIDSPAVKSLEFYLGAT